MGPSGEFSLPSYIQYQQNIPNSHFSLQLVEAAESHPRWWNSVMEVFCWKRWALRFSIPGGKMDRNTNSWHLKMGSTLETKIPDMEIIYFWMVYC